MAVIEKDLQFELLFYLIEHGNFAPYMFPLSSRLKPENFLIYHSVGCIFVLFYLTCASLWTLIPATGTFEKDISFLKRPFITNAVPTCELETCLFSFPNDLKEIDTH